MEYMLYIIYTRAWFSINFFPSAFFVWEGGGVLFLSLDFFSTFRILYIFASLWPWNVCLYC